MNCSTTRICWISTLLKQKRNKNFDPLYLVYTHISYTTVIAYEARYHNLGVVPMPDTAGIWILLGYHGMHTPGLSPFFQIFFFQVRVGYEQGWKLPKLLHFSRKNYSTLTVSFARYFSLYHPHSAATLSLDSLSLTSSLYWRQSSIGMRNKRWSKEIQIQEN